jgi:hypothetical protein
MVCLSLVWTLSPNNITTNMVDACGLEVAGTALRSGYALPVASQNKKEFHSGSGKDH